MIVESHRAPFPANYHYAATWSGLSIRDLELAIGATLSDLTKEFDGMVVPVVLIGRYNHVVLLDPQWPEFGSAGGGCSSPDPG